MSHSEKEMLSFFLTTKCNLQCGYCYNSEERNLQKDQTISLEFAKLGIDYFSKNFKSKQIRFYGPGEPTQEMALMKEISNYANNIFGNDFTIEIQTNGVFSRDALQWLLNNVNIIWISFDGPPDIQDKNRPLKTSLEGSSKYIENSIKYLKSNRVLTNQMVGARVTIVNETIERQKEIIDYFNSLNIKYIWSDPLFPPVGKKPFNIKKESLSEDKKFDLDLYVDKYLKAKKYAESKNIFYGSFLACNFDNNSTIHCRACIPVPHLTPDGFISACDMVTFGSQPYHMSPLIYGKWDKQNKSLIFFQSKIKKLQSRSVKNMPGCNSCKIKNNCCGYCLGEVLNETGNLFGKKENVCKAILKLSKEIELNLGKYRYLHP